MFETVDSRLSKFGLEGWLDHIHKIPMPTCQARDSPAPACALLRASRFDQLTLTEFDPKPRPSPSLAPLASASLDANDFNSFDFHPLELRNTMGNCLSDPSEPKKSSSAKEKVSGGQRLGSAPTPAPVAVQPAREQHQQPPLSSTSPSRNHGLQGGRNMLGDGFEDPVRAQGGAGAREAALRAAEARQAKVSH